MSRHRSVAVVGAGWAGLAAAVTLVNAGFDVTLVEAAPRPGGRARTLSWRGMRLDNGQHLLIGAYTQTLALLRILGVYPDDAFLRLPLALRMQAADGRTALDLHAPRLPAPLHLLAGLLGARGLSLAERLRALRFGLAWPALAACDPAHDIAVADWLRERGQPANLRRLLWDPLCLAVMNTPAETASARIFARVLQDAFLRRRRDSDLLLPRRPLGDILPRPAMDWLQAHGVPMVRGRITGIVADREGGWRLQGRGLDDRRHAHVVLATGHHGIARLLPADGRLERLRRDLARLVSEPIATVYLHYPATPGLKTPMLGLADGPGQWLFDRATDGHPGTVAVVISGRGEHTRRDRSALADAVRRQLARHFPRWPDPLAWQVVREKRATFRASVGIDALRPGNATAVPGLWLAGDFTATGYPATLEGAVRSGVQCALSISGSPIPQAAA